MATRFLPEMARPVPRSNAAQRGTHIRRRDRRRSDGAVAIVRSDAAAIRALMLAAMFLVGMAPGSVVSPHKSDSVQIATMGAGPHG